ncbi:uncharacterized PE-PGRS family protein PE_PGRS54-like isoform X2 [Anopheles moucheti]|nr:uncharacterized PE-PGRS family protein PE_PGRS54-like isoform X2 [Anopheles moucheti]
MDGSNIIDIRFNPDNECEDYLLKCCPYEDEDEIVVPPGTVPGTAPGTNTGPVTVPDAGPGAGSVPPDHGTGPVQPIPGGDGQLGTGNKPTGGGGVGGGKPHQGHQGGQGYGKGQGQGAGGCQGNKSCSRPGSSPSSDEQAVLVGVNQIAGSGGGTAANQVKDPTQITQVQGGGPPVGGTGTKPGSPGSTGVNQPAAGGSQPGSGVVKPSTAQGTGTPGTGAGTGQQPGGAGTGQQPGGTGGSPAQKPTVSNQVKDPTQIGQVQGGGPPVGGSGTKPGTPGSTGVNQPAAGGSQPGSGSAKPSTAQGTGTPGTGAGTGQQPGGAGGSPAQKPTQGAGGSSGPTSGGSGGVPGVGGGAPTTSQQAGSASPSQSGVTGLNAPGSGVTQGKQPGGAGPDQHHSGSGGVKNPGAGGGYNSGVINTKPDKVGTATQNPLDKTVDRPHTCGLRNADGVGFRITGDNDGESEYGEFPWMVAILKEEKALEQVINVYQCGGSLIHPSVVLTAAHCVQNRKMEEVKVRLGEWDTQTKNEMFDYQDRNVVEIVSHAEFYKGGLFNDVALLFLDKPADLMETVNTICLPPANHNFDLSQCFASGWGKDVFGKQGTYQVILKKIQLPIMPYEQCQTALRTTRLGKRFKLHKSFICAGGVKGRDTCKGDGGSPLVCPIPGTDKHYYQAGMVAWGIGCGEDGIPGVYVNVPMFRGWIDDHLRQRNITDSFYLYS